jgi:branched-chain amino acid transport system substrate-binding protein
VIVADHRPRAVALIATLAAAIGLAGCGASSPPGNKIRGDRLTIYVSVPLEGASAVGGEAVVRAARMALAEIRGRIGRYRIDLDVLDDAGITTPGGTWSEEGEAAAAQLNARQASADPTTIGYIGDFHSGASAVSIPILNRLGIAQISPASTAVGLTSSATGAEPDEPFKYYPTMKRTFARVVPSDLVQAKVQVVLQKSLGCRLTYILDDDEFDGLDAGYAFSQVAPPRGLQVVPEQPYEPNATSYLGIGQAVAQSGANCVLLAAIPDTGAAAVASEVAAQAPHALLFGTSALAEPTFTDAADGGIPEAVDSRMWITAAGGNAAKPTPAARTFDAAYRRAYGPPPPVAIDGYEAMSLLLDAIRRATHGGRRRAERSQVVAALFRSKRPASVLGAYAIRRDGDTTLDSEDVYRVQDGRLVFWRAITA